MSDPDDRWWSELPEPKQLRVFYEYACDPIWVFDPAHDQWVNAMPPMPEDLAAELVEWHASRDDDTNTFIYKEGVPWTPEQDAAWMREGAELCRRLLAALPDAVITTAFLDLPDDVG